MLISEELNKWKNWDFPKNHWLSHAFSEILAKGVMQNSTTQPSEQMHRIIKEIYHFQTNFKDIAPQVCILYLSVATTNYIRFSKC